VPHTHIPCTHEKLLGDAPPSPPPPVSDAPALQSSSLSQTQRPAAQAKPVVHARPHAPQLVGDVWTSVQPAGVWQQI
jgi:hypothetical protein